jgi:hypothetical protein
MMPSRGALASPWGEGKYTMAGERVEMQRFETVDQDKQDCLVDQRGKN